MKKATHIISHTLGQKMVFTIARASYDVNKKQ